MEGTMNEALRIILEGWETPKKALQEVLSLLAILVMSVALLAAILYAYNIPGQPAGIESAEHRAVVERHVVVRR
jgi:hypothetical protein